MNLKRKQQKRFRINVAMVIHLGINKNTNVAKEACAWCYRREKVCYDPYINLPFPTCIFNKNYRFLLLHVGAS